MGTQNLDAPAVQEPVLYDATDLQRIMGIGKNNAYKLMRTKGFPSFTVGKQYRVEHSKLMAWIDRQAHKAARQKILCKSNFPKDKKTA